MAYVSEKSWRQLQLRRLDYLYGQYVRAWEGKHTDDRDVLCQAYRQLEAAIKSLPAEPVTYVKAAMNEKMRKDRAMLDRIVRRFEKEALRA